MSQPSIAVGWLCECLQGRRPRAVDWMALLASANGNWLTPAICVALAKSTQLDHLPHDVTAFLRHIHDHNVQRNTRLLAQLLELLAAFNRAGIEPTLTKGAAHLFTSSRETFGARMMSDLDVFVETTEIAAAEQCLIDLGRQRMAGLGWGRPTDVGLIDLHYPPGSLPKYFPIATALSTHSNRESRQGVRAKIPSPTWRAAHLVVHDQIKDGDWWLGGLDVRHLYELAELTRSPEGIDWRALTSAMPDQLARDALESQLIALREMFGIAIPESALSGRFLPRWQHARRIFQARHPVISAPLRVAGCLTWLFRRAHVERTHRGGVAVLIRGLCKKLDQGLAQTLRAVVGPGRGPKA
jgi:hypothetical protein